LEFLGRNSLSFFGLHVLFFWMLDKILKPMAIFQNKLILLSIIYVIITTIIIVLIMPELKKLLPKVFGKN
jgi:fucose 4-O-acetylase-like acetyltransferase